MILTSHRESLIHIYIHAKNVESTQFDRRRRRRRMRTKAWWSLCMRMLDWSNYHLSIKLPNVKMATFECKKFHIQNISERKKIFLSFFLLLLHVLRRQAQFRFYVKFRKMNTPCQSSNVSRTRERCDQFFSYFRWPHLSWNFLYSYDGMYIGVCMCHYSSPFFHMLSWRRLCLIQLYFNTHTKKKI
jgi:hypothetical protein